MNKKKWLFVSALAVVLIAVIGVICWYFGPGVHRVFQWVHFNFEDATCYVVDRESNTVTGTTKLTLKGGYKMNESAGVDFRIDGYADEGYGLSLRLESNGQIQGVFFKDVGTTVPELENMGKIQIVDGAPVFTFTGETSAYIVVANGAEEALELVQSMKG